MSKKIMIDCDGDLFLVGKKKSTLLKQNNGDVSVGYVISTSTLKGLRDASIASVYVTRDVGSEYPKIMKATDGNGHSLYIRALSATEGVIVKSESPYAHAGNTIAISDITQWSEVLNDEFYEIG